MNPFSDALKFLSADTSDFNSLGAAKYALIAIFCALVAASLVMAAANWRADPAQRDARHAGTWAIRVLIGCMWFEGMLWKLPFSPDNGLHYWMEQMAGRAAFAIHRDLVANVMLPWFAVLNPLIFLAELAFAASMILGLGVRLMSAVAMLFCANLWLGIYVQRGGDPAEWSWSYVFLIMLNLMFILHAAGRSLGADAILRRGGAAAAGRTGLVAGALRIAT